jgi:hypothetical protein
MDSNNFNSLHEAYLSIYSEATLDRFDIPDAIGSEKNAVYAHNKPGHQAPGYKYGGRRDPQGNPEQVRVKKDISTAVARSQERQLQKQSYEYQQQLVEGVVDYLISGGYAETPEAAEVIMANMSEGWIQTIVEMDDFAAGGGNAKMKKTGMSRVEVEALGKKNLAKKSSDSSTKSSSSSASKPATTESDYKIAKLRDKRIRDDEQMDAIAAGKSPAALRRQQNRQDADSKPASAAEKQAEWDQAGDDAAKVKDWTGSVNPKYQGYLYKKRLAARNNDSNYDPSAPENQMPTSTPAKRSSRDAWNKL